jgi:hypothetical protein
MGMGKRLRSTSPPDHRISTQRHGVVVRRPCDTGDRWLRLQSRRTAIGVSGVGVHGADPGSIPFREHDAEREHAPLVALVTLDPTVSSPSLARCVAASFSHRHLVAPSLSLPPPSRTRHRSGYFHHVCASVGMTQLLAHGRHFFPVLRVASAEIGRHPSRKVRLRQGGICLVGGGGGGSLAVIAEGSNAYEIPTSWHAACTASHSPAPPA